MGMMKSGAIVQDFPECHGKMMKVATSDPLFFSLCSILIFEVDFQ